MAMQHAEGLLWKRWFQKLLQQSQRADEGQGWAMNPHRTLPHYRPGPKLMGQIQLFLEIVQTWVSSYCSSLQTCLYHIWVVKWISSEHILQSGPHLMSHCPSSSHGLWHPQCAPLISFCTETWAHNFHPWISTSELLWSKKLSSNTLHCLV